MGWKRLLRCCVKERAMWRAFYNTVTGVLVSSGSSWPDTTPPGISFKEYAAPIDFSTQMWDEASRDFVVRPAKVLIDRWEDLLTNPQFGDFQFVWNGLTASRQNRLRNDLWKWMGKGRYRAVLNSAILEE